MDAQLTRDDASSYVDLSIVSIARLIGQRKLIFFGVFITVVALSIAYAFTAKPYYRSEVILSPVAGGMGGGGAISRLLQGAGMSSFLFGGGNTRSARAVGMSALTSPFFTRAFIKDNNLLPILFEDVWDAQNKKWLVESEDDVPTLSEGYDLFVNDVLEVIDDERTGLVTIAIEWTNPAIAASWANSLVDAVNARLRAQAIENANLTIEYLNEELAKTNAVELQQALYFLIESEIEKRTVAKVQNEYAFQVLSPALPADDDKYVRPNRIFIVSAGVLGGLLLALFIVAVVGPVGTLLSELKGNRESDGGSD